ncbi:leucyl aminopeptidase family protein [Epibacterium sp. Ofav1-8]|uniref:leucyl aminopeptidase family protein n=1 Tax=Epibacterium sp. Ofav1-8 TaxID=2917735 RepID=UPI001EF74186|nr:leucyl aminopeptidase family protein [Epibacterium sp. Ofav1-8]MCG7623557.1 leucyl aminopeptidase family protein [Epibacterium sp. Ofav1-8]
MQPHFAVPNLAVPTFAPASDAGLPLHIVTERTLDAWLAQQDGTTAGWARSMGFAGAWGQVVVLPGADGTIRGALIGAGTPKTRQRQRFLLAAAAAKLPEGTYALASDLPADLSAEVECFGWLMAQYAFDRYAKTTGAKACLIAPDGVDAARVEAMAAGETFTRTLINTPAEDMGPAELQQAVESLAEVHGATVSTVIGEDLLAQNFPLIHTVGRAADRAPRLIDMRWGNEGPTLTLVGKGVCFDTGGLNLKPGASMALMKKDMGGSANVLGLAHMIMATGLRLQLRVLIPAVENAVSGLAFRPGDIFTSRKGLTVEVNNTDAEGRLVLADALALAQEDTPDLLISMATLTGAARVAVGTDIAPFFTDREGDAVTLASNAQDAADPVWRLPFHDPYEAMIEPGIADLDNAPAGGFAGAITAALFLRRFAGDARYMHFDVFGWSPSSLPARPKGGVGQGTRALFQALPEMLGLS